MSNDRDNRNNNNNRPGQPNKGGDRTQQRPGDKNRQDKGGNQGGGQSW